MDAGSRKQKYCDTTIKDGVSKKLKLDYLLDEYKTDQEPQKVETFYNSSEFLSTNNLVKFMYRLDLSILCLLRKIEFQNKYPRVLVTFEDDEIDMFNDIIIHINNESIRVHTEYTSGSHYVEDIIYATLFVKRKQTSTIHDYFNSFVKYCISRNNSRDNIKYLIIYTNSNLDLTQDNQFKQGRSKHFYPFEFDSAYLNTCDILRDFLSTTKVKSEISFYQLSQNKRNKEEFSKRLEFSTRTKKEIESKQLPEKFVKKVKDLFFKKLVFAVDQPDREQLNIIVKNEVKHTKYDYMEMQENILYSLAAPGKSGFEILYEFNILLSFIHDMFFYGKFSSITYKTVNTSNIIEIDYKGKISCVHVHPGDKKYSYYDLFPSSKNAASILPLNKLLSVFTKELEKTNNIKLFITYTNANLDFAEGLTLKKDRAKYFQPLEFVKIDIEKKKYKILKHSSCVNRKGLYQFSQVHKTLLCNLLQDSFSDKKNEANKVIKLNENKETFLQKLVFACGQSNMQKLVNDIKSQINLSDVIYSYEELFEVILRWLELREAVPINEKLIRQILDDVKSFRFTNKRIKIKDISEEILFATSAGGPTTSRMFRELLHFLISEKGKFYLSVLKKNGIKLSMFSNVMNKTGLSAVMVFEKLYHLLFDGKGNKTQCLKSLQDNGISLGSIATMLRGARIALPQALEDLYCTWFDEKGNQTYYLTTLKKESISLSTMCGILYGAGCEGPQAFKNLYDLWFDNKGQKTKYLNVLESHGINVANLTTILSHSGAKADQSFKDLYNLWFDVEGNKTYYLKNLEKSGINLSTVTSALISAGNNAANTFRNLHNLWFDKEGNKTKYLETLEKNGIDITTMTAILRGSSFKMVHTWKSLYNLWFDEQGNKTKRLRNLEEAGFSLTNISAILHTSSTQAAESFLNLYSLWFDEQGNRTLYVQTLEKNEINLGILINIMSNAGRYVAKTFIDLYNLWFDNQGNKSRYLTVLEYNELSLATISQILRGARSKIANAFKNLYNLWFDEDGKKSQYLKVFEENGLSLNSTSSILYGCGFHAAKSFRELHDLWFDEDGNKSFYLKSLEENGITITSVSNILAKTGTRSSKAFKDLYNIWFDDHGQKKRCFIVLESNGISISNITCMFQHTGLHAAKVFRDLYDLLFDEQGSQSIYLNALQKNGLTLSSMSSILVGSGLNSIKAFRDLLEVLFRKNGKKTKYSKIMEKHGIELSRISSFLMRSGSKAAKTFKGLYYLWFDENGKKTPFFEVFEENGLKITRISATFHSAGCPPAKSFKYLHTLWFDQNGYQTLHLKELKKQEINLHVILDLLKDSKAKRC